MKTALKVATVLTWFNLIFWGLILVALFLGVLLTGQTVILAGVVLLSAIPLNCYAALKLHTSIRYARVPLSHQTPVGIRFVGLMALFFGFTFIFTGGQLFSNPKPGLEAFSQFTEQFVKPVQAKLTGLAMTFVRSLAVAFLLLGVLVVVNVILNLRLLRWYYLVRKSDVS